MLLGEVVYSSGRITLTKTHLQVGSKTFGLDTITDITMSCENPPRVETGYKLMGWSVAVIIVGWCFAAVLGGNGMLEAEKMVSGLSTFTAAALFVIGFCLALTLGKGIAFHVHTPFGKELLGYTKSDKKSQELEAVRKAVFQLRGTSPPVPAPPIGTHSVGEPASPYGLLFAILALVGLVAICAFSMWMSGPE